MATFDLRTVFINAFGYDPPAPDDADFSMEAAAARTENSTLGQPFYKTDLSGREFFLPVTLNNYLVPFAVIGMTWKKTIVSTPMPERGGSVNELISIDDYVFNIKGIILNDENALPEQQIIDLHNIFKINASVIMRSVLSDIVLSGIADHRVIVKQMNWVPVSGVEHAKPFEMDVISDQIFDLEID